MKKKYISIGFQNPLRKRSKNRIFSEKMRKNAKNEEKNIGKMTFFAKNDEKMQKRRKKRRKNFTEKYKGL